MKITKQYLKRLIKEELEKALHEGPFDDVRKRARKRAGRAWDELEKQNKPQDKSKFAKDEAAIPATLKAAKAEVAKETDSFKELDIWLSYGITMTTSHYVFELQSGKKLKMAKRR